MNQEPSSLEPSLTELLAALTDAVGRGDRAGAQALALEIRQRLMAESAWLDEAERQVGALLAALDRQSPIIVRLVGDVGASSWPLATDDRHFVVDRGEAPQCAGIPAWSMTTAAPANGEVYPVWFGTNRRPDGAGGYGGERDTRVHYGRALVQVPEAHRFGETGSGFWTRLLRLDLRDDRLRLRAVESRTPAACLAEVAATVAAAREAGEQAQAMVYLHGYNTSFEEAAIRAAQIGYDLKVPATAFFSWPSQGTLAAYPADEAAIEASERLIADFLVAFARDCGTDRVHLVAHSMGNRGLLRALQRIAAEAGEAGVRFAQVFLAAPDVDRDLFLDLARLYPRHSERTTLYASAADRAVHLSSRLHGAPRAGYFEPYTVVPGVDTVAVPDFDLDLLGHGYFAQAEALLHDLFELMRHDSAPTARQRLRPLDGAGAGVWSLVR
ncbi:alpha/beta hydrolase [Marichromatium sp. AB32]|uniref:alpha/beta hydrolase n=1 Tax=Marichromatium sp. AB32 TaxID=2483363 RepID=UPI000F417F6B|nr:alpha/beta hydrolase [Marichromatium sp. AB32]RNE91797.1 alpha/beta hydrolase [Marichromatium sp. AB32]